MKTRGMSLVVAFAAVASLLLSGCVSSQVEKARPADQVTLTVARSGDSATIQWLSYPNRNYTVFFADKLGGASQWKPLPSAINLRGTGEIITVMDSVPESKQRYYRVQIAVAPGAKD